MPAEARNGGPTGREPIPLFSDPGNPWGFLSAPMQQSTLLEDDADDEKP
jgi:hypothetical protein